MEERADRLFMYMEKSDKEDDEIDYMTSLLGRFFQKRGMENITINKICSVINTSLVVFCFFVCIVSVLWLIGVI